MPPQAPLSLRVIHYSTPIAVVLFSVVFSTTSVCIIPRSKRTIIKKCQRKRAKWIALAVAILYANEGLIYILQACLQVDRSAGQDAIVYVALSTIVWSAVFFVLEDAGTVYRSPNLASWIVTIILEVMVCLIQFSSSSRHNGFDNTRLVINMLRICCLAGLCISATVSDSPLVHVDVERQLLLRSVDTAPTTAEYGSIPKPGTLTDNEESDQADHGGIASPKAVDEQSQRLQLLGGWWKFRMLAPQFIPLQERKHQGFALVVVIVIICDRLSNLIGPRLLGDIVSRIARADENNEIPWRQILILILGIKIPHDHILVPLRSICSVRLYYASYRKVLISTFSHIMSLSLEFHENKNTGKVEATMRQGESLTRLFDECMDSFIPLFLDLTVAFVYLSWMFSVRLGVVLAFIYVSYVIVSYKFTAWLSTRRRKYLSTDVEVRDFLNQSMSNWQMAVYFNRQDHLNRHLEALVGREVDGMARFNDLSHVKNLAQGLVMTLGYGVVLVLAAQQVVLEKQPVGNIVTLLLYWNIITRPLFVLANSYKDISNYLVDSERLLQIRQLTATVADVEGAPDLEFRGGKIEYRNVHFAYEEGNPLIKGLDFTVEPGSTIAFVGATGSGKTTTCDKLLFRLYDVTEGSILIDDQDIRYVTQYSLRENMGIVRQDQTFYNVTIMENVRFARLEATDEEVHEACRNAVIHDKILSFPKGYDSKIGERGVKLSGGEKQRLFIAQLFLRDPKIVVLDEATSTVDNVTETEIQESFARICKGRTTVIIAHRLSTVKDADQIFVLDQGEIVERGTHDELLDQRGKYYDLWATKRTVEKMQKVLTHGKLVTEREDIPSASTAPLIDLSGVSDDMDGFSSDDDTDIFQVDGASESKHMKGSNPPRTGIRRRMHDVTSRFTNTKPDMGQSPEDEFGDEAQDNAPIKPISPTPTASSFCSRPARRSLSIKRKSITVARSSSQLKAKRTSSERRERGTHPSTLHEPLRLSFEVPQSRNNDTSRRPPGLKRRHTSTSASNPTKYLSTNRTSRSPGAVRPSEFITLEPTPMAHHVRALNDPTSQKRSIPFNAQRSASPSTISHPNPSDSTPLLRAQAHLRAIQWKKKAALSSHPLTPESESESEIHYSMHPHST